MSMSSAAIPSFEITLNALSRILDDVSFRASDLGGQTVTIDAAYVQEHVGDLAKNADLSRFIL